MEIVLCGTKLRLPKGHGDCAVRLSKFGPMPTTYNRVACFRNVAFTDVGTGSGLILTWTELGL